MALIEYYGKECPHCSRIEPVVAQLEKELKVTVERRETWHDEKNAELFRTDDKGRCGGVPFFLNTESGKHICGATTFDNLKLWAQGK